MAITSIIANSCYMFDGVIRRQNSGLTTGEDLARAAARNVMLDRDRKVLKLSHDNALHLDYHERYVDDSEEAAKALAPGTRWVEGPWARGLGRLVVLEELVQGDLTIPADIRTMQEFVKLGSSINPDIKLTGDCPSVTAQE